MVIKCFSSTWLFIKHHRRLLNPNTFSLTPCCSQFHKMSAVSRPDHMQRTADNTRDTSTSTATVVEMGDLSATVKSLVLKLDNHNVTFKAGQWVDFCIPSVPVVGGYSMCSAPHSLTEQHTLHLAVKFSKHPPAYWVHTQCAAGSRVSVRVGGDFWYAPRPSSPPRPVLLVAGGVGINPMLSMLRHARDLRHQHAAGEAVHNPGKVLLMYSATSLQELIFREQIDSLCELDGFDCWYYLTKEKSSDTRIRAGRISSQCLSSALRHLSGDEPLSEGEAPDCYLCGPGPMTDAMEAALREQGVGQDHIHYEKWW